MLDGLALQLRHSVQRFHREQTLDEEDDAAMLASFRKMTSFAMHVFHDLLQHFLSVKGTIFDSGGKRSQKDLLPSFLQVRRFEKVAIVGSCA